VGIDEKREFCEIVKDHLVDLILYCLGLTGLEYLGTGNNYDARVFSIWTIIITITLLFHIAKRGCSAAVNLRNSPRSYACNARRKPPCTPVCTQAMPTALCNLSHAAVCPSLLTFVYLPHWQRRQAFGRVLKVLVQAGNHVLELVLQLLPGSLPLQRVGRRRRWQGRKGRHNRHASRSVRGRK